jgi:hypothetical protein
MAFHSLLLETACGADLAIRADVIPVRIPGFCHWFFSGITRLLQASLFLSCIFNVQIWSSKTIADTPFRFATIVPTHQCVEQFFGYPDLKLTI